MIKLRISIIFFLDTFIFFGSLVLILLIRYDQGLFNFFFAKHLPFFIVLFFLCSCIFYLADLYQLEVFKKKSILLVNLFWALAVLLLVSVVFLYFFGGFFQITPKTNLLIFLMVFFILDYLGRIFLNKVFFVKHRIPVVFVGESSAVLSLIKDLQCFPQLGYEVVSLVKKNEMNFENLKLLFRKKTKTDMIVVLLSFENKEKFSKLIYFLSSRAKVIDFIDFYETIYKKEPLDLLNNAWFVNNLSRHYFLDIFKRAFDVFLSLVLLLLFSPLILICVFLVKISSPGSFLFRQKVWGKNNKVFILHKLRTMEEGKEYPLWTIPGDKRVTRLGIILRFSHLDELPQLYNILKGDLSFVGPRPERAELAKIFEEKLPFYNIRRMIKPGLTGWAQINYGPSSSTEEAFEKLKYDFYYLKNRSFLLDLLIILKTVKLLFISPK